MIHEPTPPFLVRDEAERRFQSLIVGIGGAICGLLLVLLLVGVELSDVQRWLAVAITAVLAGVVSVLWLVWCRKVDHRAINEFERDLHRFQVKQQHCALESGWVSGLTPQDRLAWERDKLQAAEIERKQHYEHKLAKLRLNNEFDLKEKAIEEGQWTVSPDFDEDRLAKAFENALKNYRFAAAYQEPKDEP